MTAPDADARFARIVHQINPHSALLLARPLAGGVSARVTALDIAQPGGQTQTLIVRRHGALDLARNPNIAQDEFRLLQFLQAVGVPAPVPYLADSSDEIFESPYIVVSYMEGKPEFAPADLPNLLAQMAAQLARLHQIDGLQVALSFLPRQEKVIADWLQRRPATVDDSMSERRIRDTLAAVWPLPQRNRSVLLHGDFWPGNLLWQAEQLAGIIDWEDATVGDPLVDLGKTRLEVLWAYGGDAMHEFTRQYLAHALIDSANLPYWDLSAALNHCGRLSEWALGDTALEQKMRSAHNAFVAQAFAGVGDQ
jgi:aminoglycoside phosphotransferase (APT) family kinase protein